MQYATKKEKIRQKIRQCLIKEDIPCQRYDRPINCAEDTVEYASGVRRCPSFKEADLDELNFFYAEDSDRYSIAWNRDKRKYIIYRNNVIIMEYSMASLDWALTNFWELQKNLSIEE